MSKNNCNSSRSNRSEKDQRKIMVARRFLQTPSELQELIQRKSENLENLNSMACRMTSQISGAPSLSLYPAISFSREFGFISKHPTTGAAIASPFVSMAQAYNKQTPQLWYQIFQLVKENCSTPFSGTPQDDVMERLLSECGY